MQNSSSTAGRKWAYGTTSTVRMSSWPELRADRLRSPRLARTYVVDGRRQQEEVVASVHGILLALLRDVARPAATRVREVGRGALATAGGRFVEPAGGRDGREEARGDAWAGWAARQRPVEWMGAPRVLRKENRIERGPFGAKASKTGPSGLRCATEYL